MDQQSKPGHRQIIGTLAGMAEKFHLDFCVIREGIPQKPASERKICLEQIYGYAAAHDIDTAIVDEMMDQAEKKHAQYESA
jgi:hypothetical protein